MKNSQSIDSMYQVIAAAKNANICHLYTKDTKLTRNLIEINDQHLINFGSCSYLGLEFDKRLIQSGIDAINNYGTQFSASRSYVSCGLYESLEEKLNKIFNAYCLATPTTTLGHIATIPTIIDSNDVVILDHQVHASVQNAVQLLKSKGIKVEMIRHSRMDKLEDRIKFLSSRYEKIWYMADGIYSMYGDKAPLADMYALMNKYPQFHCYVDDAHGMSCYGENGQGYVLSQNPIHEKMIVAASLNKAFAAGGGTIIFPNEEWLNRVRVCGGPMITSGPMQPSALGVANKSADIHLSPEIHGLQEELHENIKYTNLLFKKSDLPLASYNDTPIFFLACGLPKVGYNLVKRMIDAGFYSNIGIFPAVPMKNTGLRFTITKLNTFEQIESFTEAMAYHYPKALEEEGSSREEVNIAFGFKTEEEKLDEEIQSLINSSNLKVEHKQTISNIDKKEWDSIFEGKGTFDWEGLSFIEKTFTNNKEMENNWVFDYIIIRNATTNEPVLATFATTSLVKDDMFADSNISDQIEYKRKTENPYYLTSKAVSLGSFITLGEHLFVDFDSDMADEAIEILLKRMSDIQSREKASSIILRDFKSNNERLENLITKNGYFRSALLDDNVVEHPVAGEALLKRVSYKTRKHLRKQVFKFKDMYDVKVCSNASKEQISHWYDLYLNVKNSKLELNTFVLPSKIFEQVALSDKWEVIELSLKSEYTSESVEKPVAVVINYKSGDTYNAMMIGIDYDFMDFKPYQQVVHACLERAEQLGATKLALGLTSSFEKRKFGATQVPMHSYVQIKDHYNMSVIQTMSKDNNLMMK